MIRVVGFDFDGTLIMSEERKAPAMVEVFKEMFGVKRGVKSAYLSLVGKGYNRDAKVEYLCKKFLKRKCDKKELLNISDHFGKHYVKEMNSCPMFKCVNLLKELRRQVDKVFLLSLENEKEVRKIAGHCGISKYFDDILGGPDGKVDNLKKLISRYKVKGNEIVYVGDTHGDVIAAKKLKMKVVLLGKKHVGKKLKEHLQADFVFSDLCEIK